MASEKSLEKELARVVKDMEALEQTREAALADGNINVAEKSAADLEKLAVRADLHRQSLKALISKREASEREQRREELTGRRAEILAAMDRNNKASLLLHDAWQKTADRAGRGAAMEAWSQQREDNLLTDVRKMVKEVEPLLKPVDLGAGDSLEGAYGATRRELETL